MTSMSTSDTPNPTTGLRTWNDRDDEPGADVGAVVDCMGHWLWEHRGGERPWWCGYGVTWEDLRQRGPFLKVGSYVPHPWDGEPDE